MASRKHLMAANRTIRAAHLDENGLDAMIVELLRDLARRMDSAGPDGPPLNLVRAYQSATKDLSRAMARKPARTVPQPTTESTEKVVLRAVEENPLVKARRQAGREA